MKVVKYPVGSLVKARFSEDDKWYLANVVSVNVDTQQYSVKVRFLREDQSLFAMIVR